MPEIPLERIRPNPYQPEGRIEIDEETAKKFGLSILEHGLIMTPVVRLTFEGTETAYQMGDGWLRFKGYCWLRDNGHPEFTHLPVVERELTDRQMADMIMESNTIRQDLTAIDEAKLYQRYIKDFRVSETQLAKDHNMTQGAIANTIRLLQLPEALQEKVISREISSTHARQLLRLNNAPQLQEGMAKDCISHNLSVNQLSDQINAKIWHESKSLNLKGESHWEKPAFDVSGCKNCDSKSEAHRPWGEQKKEARCLTEECWLKKNSAAVQASVKQAQEELGKKGVKAKILTSKDLNYNQYERLDERALAQLDNPEECEACTKTALYKHSIADREEPDKVCIEPACFRKKKTKKTKDTNKVRKEQDRELTVKLGELFRHVEHSPRECLLVLAKHALPRLQADGRQDLTIMFEVPKLSNGRLDLDALIASLKDKPLEELLQLTVAADLTLARRSSAYHDYSTELKDNEKHDCAILTGTLEAHVAGVTAFQEANCRGCLHAKERLIGTGEECCDYTYYKRVNADGVCVGRKQRSEGETSEEEEEEEEGVGLVLV